MRADRVNLFPLAYHQGDNTSLLWPIIDADPHGFAIRPLLNVEKDDIAVLFPLSSVNTKRKAGWLLTAYRNEDAFGLFPLMHISDDFHWIIPWWNVRDEEGWGLLPLYGDYGDGLKNISLAWWDRDTNKKLQRFGVFPLYYQRADNSESWLWPIYGRHVNENGNYNGWAASGLAHWDGNDKGRRARWLHPLYYDVTDGEDRTFAILPLWGMFKDASSSFWITPLGGYGQTDKGRSHAVSLARSTLTRTGPTATRSGRLSSAIGAGRLTSTATPGGYGLSYHTGIKLEPPISSTTAHSRDGTRINNPHMDTSRP